MKTHHVDGIYWEVFNQLDGTSYVCSSLGFGNPRKLSSNWLEIKTFFNGAGRVIGTPLSVRHDLETPSCHVALRCRPMGTYRCGKRWRLPWQFTKYRMAHFFQTSCRFSIMSFDQTNRWKLPYKLLEVFRETKDTKSLTSAHTKGPFNNPFLSFPFASSCHKAEAQANERREVPEQKIPGRDGRPGLTYGFSYIRERWKELASISAKTAENRDNLEVGRCDVFQRRVWICCVCMFVCWWYFFPVGW